MRLGGMGRAAEASCAWGFAGGEWSVAPMFPVDGSSKCREEALLVGPLRALAMSAMGRARLATYPARCLSGVSGGARISAWGRPVAGFSGKAVVVRVQVPGDVA